MKVDVSIIHVAVSLLCLAGCQTQQPKEPQVYRPNPTPTPAPVLELKDAVKLNTHKPRPIPQPRKRTPEQVQMLSDFAMKESPRIWQTIQAMRGEITESDSKLNTLRADLLEFDRNPDTDEDYKTLDAGLKELKRAYDAIFDRLEDAYIAAKKYEASPSRKDYQDTMKRALEDGIQDANMATERYKAMTRQK